ncbi:cyclin-dependent protein kinase inhibitor SMR15-like [Macadamia integrifolia]|uniref:cyclin-dependent protein kinase inhibitor SMR15-like n=1 Tax=Macadamia integrifolia TaxID=60698 RepID=UPI001C4F46B2|nr:cyclin-dependent protein kinase inhibitor SMR15-like [Macadamia integrifolia]
MVSLCRAKDMPSPASSSTGFFKRLEGSERVEGGKCSLAANTEGEAVKKLTIAVKEEEEKVWSEERCCTPKAKECRIQEVLTCPPAPRKRRTSYSSPLALRVKETETETEMETEYFFSPPNLESIFALHDAHKVKFKN